MYCDRYKELDAKATYHHTQAKRAFADISLTAAERKRILRHHKLSEMNAKNARGHHLDTCIQCKKE